MRSSALKGGKRRHPLLVLALSFVTLAACSEGHPAAPDLPIPGLAGGGLGDGGSGASRCDASPTATAAAVKTCLTPGEDPSACLATVFRPYLQERTTVSALAFLQCLEDTDDAIRADCHPVAHAIGRETFAIKGTVDAAFQACDQTCHSGCYHGVMERFLRGESAEGVHISLGEIQARVATACAPTMPLLLRFQCLHGLGHAIMYYADYDLKLSLSICDATGDDWSASSCWGGVFMENLVSATPELRNVSPTDYHYPCDSVGDRYEGACYGMQTSRMTEMGLSPAQIFVECRNAGAYALTCIESLGRDLSNAARVGDSRSVSATCELGTGDQVQACTRGVVHALEDNTWDGRYSLTYCATYAAGDGVAYCYATAMQYLKDVYNRGPDELARECNEYVPGVQACLAAAAR